MAVKIHGSGTEVVLLAAESSLSNSRTGFVVETNNRHLSHHESQPL